VLQVAAAELGKALSAKRTSVQIGVAAWPATTPLLNKRIRAEQPDDERPRKGRKKNGRPPMVNE
ncbi:MAG TPA: hypothetical protein DEP47_09655, partial [Chloroflexi bacterium]|nr:hypothetical protein [Chloroflexota bacterium]